MKKVWWEKRIFNLPSNKQHFLKTIPWFQRPLYQLGYLIESLQTLLYFPIILLVSFFKKIIWIFLNFPILIKQSILFIYLWIDKIIFMHKYLRKSWFLLILKKNIIGIIFCYLILSIFDEITYTTDHPLALLNENWTISFYIGFDYYLYAIFLYNLFWIWSLYFIELIYFFKNNWELFLWVSFCGIDIATPDTSYLTIECFVVYLELTCYWTAGLVFVWMDEDSGDTGIIEGSDDSGDHGINLKELLDDTFPERKMWQSWQRDYFFHLMKTTTDITLKKDYEKKYKLWVDHDVENYDEYVL